MRRATASIRHQPKSGEDEQQKALINWCHMYTVPHLGQKLSEYIFHIPNGGKRGKAEAGIFKAMGTKAGVSDLFVPIPVNQKHGLWLEMKDVIVPSKPKPRTQPSQIAWLEKMVYQGYEAAVVYGWLEARETILSYFGDTRHG